ncbi:hypothetical protein Zmor_008696 [Zophobas morio]|uniref:Uncharacterized protein n=1 Tax=Zophobas morio TaxID=2755281 RepID=A0AA38M1N7_9CUCU|nr:hypothetical protein Zmor_008696 [Zophobas morio]
MGLVATSSAAVVSCDNIDDIHSQDFMDLDFHEGNMDSIGSDILSKLGIRKEQLDFVPFFENDKDANAFIDAVDAKDKDGAEAVNRVETMEQNKTYYYVFVSMKGQVDNNTDPSK